MHPQNIPDIPQQTVEVARASFPKGNIYMKIRDTLGSIFEEEVFADLFPQNGQPAYTPWRLALVCIMQFMENLSDRQAADAVRGHIDWKYMLSLALTDSGFDYSILSEFRTRLLAGGAEQKLLDILLHRLKESGLLKTHRRQRTDSTHVLGAIRTLNRLETLGEGMRVALDSLAVVAPDWLATNIQPDWFDRYGRRVENYRLPKLDSEREALGSTIGADGLALLDAIYDKLKKHLNGKLLTTNAQALNQHIHLCLRRSALRQSRYIGLKKTHSYQVFIACALNLVRLDAWLNGIPLAKTRSSRFKQLQPQGD